MNKHILIVGGRATGKTNLMKRIAINLPRPHYWLSDHSVDTSFGFSEISVDTRAILFDGVSGDFINDIAKLAMDGVLVNRRGKTAFKIWPQIIASVQSANEAQRELINQAGFDLCDLDKALAELPF